MRPRPVWSGETGRKQRAIALSSAPPKNALGRLDMDMNYSAEEDASWLEARGWFGADPPIDLQAKVQNHLRMNKTDFVRWRILMATRGWAAPDWPVECGGAGRTSAQKNNFHDECARAVQAAKARGGKAARNVVQSAIKMTAGMGVTDELALGYFCKRLMMMIESCLGDSDHHPVAFAALAQAM